MLNKIIYTFLGIGIALFFFLYAAKDPIKIPQVSGITTQEVSVVTPQNTTPEMASTLASPDFSAKSVLAYDLDSGSVLYSKNVDEKLPIASVTKLMTALIVEKNGNFEDVVTIKRSEQGVLGTNMGLIAGETITVENLLKGMLIPSSNDAAVALSDHIAGSQDKFAQLMNQQAADLGMTSTHYDNPVGWDSNENFSNTLDLLKLSEEFMKHPHLAAIAKIKDLTVQSTDGIYSHKLRTSNELLLDDPNVEGLKTGFTSKALGNLVILYNHNGSKILTIVLGSENREQDSRNLLDWLFKVYQW